MTRAWPDPQPPPMSQGVYKYDPNTFLRRANSAGMIGWPGSFPQTPCLNCGCEYFRWVGDWNLGFACVECKRQWKEPISGQ